MVIAEECYCQNSSVSGSAQKKQLLGTAKAIIVEEGLQRFTMEALAQTAGVTPPLIYYYFSGRQALLKSLLVQDYESYRLKTVAEVGAAKSFDDVVRSTAKSFKLTKSQAELVLSMSSGPLSRSSNMLGL